MNNYGGKPTSLVFRTLALHLNHGLEVGSVVPRSSMNYEKRWMSVYGGSRKNLWATEGLTGRILANRQSVNPRESEASIRNRPRVDDALP
jgi:hypothetical protein